MWRHINIAIRLAFVTLIITGIIYPLLITGIAQIAFPRQANGSLVKQGGKVTGSELIGQQFTRPEYFQPRPSAAGNGYDATASGGSNLGPTSRQLISRVQMDIDHIRKDNPSLGNGQIPVDMVTTSASGLDPDITPANAYVQLLRVAKVRGISKDEVKKLVDANTTKRQFGILGEPRINVLKLNMALNAAGKAGIR